MKEFKGTKGLHVPVVCDEYCIGVGVKLANGYYQMTANSILPDTDEEYEKEKEEIEANMRLYAAAPELLEACQEALKELRFHDWGNTKTGFLLEQVINKALGE